jgi:hypothetical protein
MQRISTDFDALLSLATSSTPLPPPPPGPAPAASADGLPNTETALAAELAALRILADEDGQVQDALDAFGFVDGDYDDEGFY